MIGYISHALTLNWQLSLSIIREACPCCLIGEAELFGKCHSRRPVCLCSGGSRNGRVFGTNEAPLENGRNPRTTVTYLHTFVLLGRFGYACFFFGRQPTKHQSKRDAWESDSARHHPAVAIVSRLLLLTRGMETSFV